MPELPEVETVCRGLQKILSKQPVLRRVELRRADLRNEMPLLKLQSLEGQKVLAVKRRAKYLIFETKKGLLISHLGMTGSWRVESAENMGKHDHVVLHFGSSLRLVFRDPRRFGILDFKKSLSEPPFTEMGPEPFSDEFNVDYLRQQLKKRASPIKNALMDQRVVVGIGNIYASEILFEAGIRPQRRSGQLKAQQLQNIIDKTREVLERSIVAGGSTLQDFVHADGEVGEFQDQFKVYGKSKENCSCCGQKIRSQIIAGRNTFWCSKCQG